MKEAEFTKQTCNGLEKLGCVVYPIVAQTFGVSGWPDRLVVCPPPIDKIVLLEFKGVKTPLETRQRLIMARVNRCSADTCFVVRQGESMHRLMSHDESKLYGFFATPEELWQCLKTVLGN